jgi:two-component system phosphate regulon response regulator PhoB
MLVVEDEAEILELMRYNLAREGYHVLTATTGEAAIASARSTRPDLVVLDLMLPGIDGLEVCRLLKRDPATQAIQIVMVTAKGEESDIVAGLELGADDYITKPFSPKVLVARLRAVLRRAEQAPGDEQATVHTGDLVIDPARHEVTVAGNAVDLTATQFRILHYLARRPGWVFTRTQIVDAVHGEDYPVTDRSVDVHVVALRRKLGDAGDRLETVRGVGYRFRE